MEKKIINVKSFDGFEKIMKFIKEQMDYDKECHNCFSKILPNDYVSGYDNSYIYKTSFEMLKYIFKDKNDWIDYFVYELDFGKQNDKLKCYDENKKEIPLSSIKDLYNLLTKK